MEGFAERGSDGLKDLHAGAAVKRLARQHLVPQLQVLRAPQPEEPNLLRSGKNKCRTGRGEVTGAKKSSGNNCLTLHGLGWKLVVGFGGEGEHIPRLKH